MKIAAKNAKDREEKNLVSWWQSFHGLRATAGRHDELIKDGYLFFSLYFVSGFL